MGVNDLPSESRTVCNTLGSLQADYKSAQRRLRSSVEKLRAPKAARLRNMHVFPDSQSETEVGSRAPGIAHGFVYPSSSLSYRPHRNSGMLRACFILYSYDGSSRGLYGLRDESEILSDVQFQREAF